MATQEDEGESRKRPELKEHPFVANLVRNSSASRDASPPDVTILSGYLAKDTQPGRWRLYLSLELSEFFTIDEADIVHSHEPATGEESLQPTKVWVKREATLQFTSVDSVQAEAASFLQGEIMARSLAGTDPRLAGGGEVYFTTPIVTITIRVTIRLCPRTPAITPACTPLCITEWGPWCRVK